MLSMEDPWTYAIAILDPSTATRPVDTTWPAERCRWVSGFDNDAAERDETGSIPVLDRNVSNNGLISGILEVGRFTAPDLAVAMGIRVPESSQRLRDLCTGAWSNETGAVGAPRPLALCGLKRPSDN